MKGLSKIFCLLLILISSGNLAGQGLNRILETLEVGEILVLSSTSNEMDENGEEEKTVRYQAITSADISIENCLEVMKETMFHNDIISDASEAVKIKTVSDDEWFNYYRFDGGFGMPDYDCVMNMKYFGNDSAKSFAIAGKASPFIVEDKGIARIESYEILCAVRELEKDKVEITISAEYTPIFSAPDWKLRIWYPEPASLMEGMIYLAEGL